MERGFFIKSDLSGITAIDAAFFERLEACVTHEVGLQVSISHVVLAIVLDEPYVCIACFLEYRFEGQRDRATMSVFGKSVIAACIFQ